MHKDKKKKAKVSKPRFIVHNYTILFILKEILGALESVLLKCPAKMTIQKHFLAQSSSARKKTETEYNRKNKNRRQMRIATSIFAHSNFQNKKEKV